jgi:hypothetical protein
MQSLRTIAAVSTQQDYDIEQLDVQTAYLNSELKEKVYGTVSDGFVALLKSDDHTTRTPGADINLPQREKDRRHAHRQRPAWTETSRVGVVPYLYNMACLVPLYD